MNFMNVKFKAGAKDVVVTLPNNEEIKYPLKELKEIKDKYIDGSEQELVLGIRGEHISIANKGIEATVSFVEILGNTTNVLCKLEGLDNEINVTVQERSSLSSGDKIHLSFNSKDVHLFDKENERTVYSFDSEAVEDEK